MLCLCLIRMNSWAVSVWFSCSLFFFPSGALGCQILLDRALQASRPPHLALRSLGLCCQIGNHRKPRVPWSRMPGARAATPLRLTPLPFSPLPPRLPPPSSSGSRNPAQRELGPVTKSSQALAHAPVGGSRSCRRVDSVSDFSSSERRKSR